MRTHSSSQCLETMGIQVWHQCSALSGAPSLQNFEAYTLHDASNKQIGVLCLESLLVPAEQIAPMFRLLDAMLSAIQLKRAPILENHLPQDTSVILLMGESLIQTVLASDAPLDTLRAGNIHTHNSNAKMLVTYHPFHLLLAPANKAKAWEDLKKIAAM